MKSYIKLFRVSHYLKNILIFTPLIFSKNLFVYKDLLLMLYMLIPFCLVSSVIYVINDIKDVEKDKKHPQKCKRPIASGAISICAARASSFVLIGITCLMLLATIWMHCFCLQAIILLIVFFGINFSYSSGLKNIPILDIILLAAGYLIRVFYGASIVGVEVSPWLYLTVLTGALYLGMGKRRNEIKNNGENSRKVLQKYNYEFLDKNMHVCVGLAMTFYALWAIQNEYAGMIWTVPFIIVILMKYSLDVENDESEADPMNVVLEDKALIVLAGLYAVTVFLIIYVL